MKTKKFSFKKAELFARHERIRKSGVSPMREAAIMVKAADPDLSKTIGRQEKYYLEGKEAQDAGDHIER